LHVLGDEIVVDYDVLVQQNCLMFDKIRPFSDGYDAVQSPDPGNHAMSNITCTIYMDVSKNSGTPKSSIKK